MFPRILSIDRTVLIGLVGTTLATSTSTIAPTLSTFPSTTPPSDSMTSSNSVDSLLMNGTDFFMNFTSTATTSNHYRTNESAVDDDEPFKKDFVFDRTDVRVIFITMYTLVFCCCFFGEYWLLHKTKLLYSPFHNYRKWIRLSHYTEMIFHFFQTFFFNRIKQKLTAHCWLTKSIVCHCFISPSHNILRGSLRVLLSIGA